MTNCSMDSLSAGEAAAKEVAEEAAVEALIGDIVKMCEEEGTKVGNEVYGEFGGSIGKEAAVTAGTKAARIKIRQLIEVVAADMGKASGGEAGEAAGKEELGKTDLKAFTKDKGRDSINLKITLLQKSNLKSRLQGDTSGCDEPPVDFTTKVPLWPCLSWPGQAKTKLLF